MRRLLAMALLVGMFGALTGCGSPPPPAPAPAPAPAPTTTTESDGASLSTDG